jgi:hypothetical protein
VSRLFHSCSGNSWMLLFDYNRFSCTRGGMFNCAPKSLKGCVSWLGSSLLGGLLVVTFLLIDDRSASALPIPTAKVYAIPAFARKYGMPCSACHEAWPKLNNFGQTFKDNGYQMGNDRDAPIYQHPAYWPITLRITPQWHRESFDKADVTNPATGATAEARLTMHGFDLTGMDILTGGTLAKNISFLLVPSSDNTGAFHFESANVRFSNLLHSSWLNIKAGKFELDNIISEKRILALSDTGGIYQIYHFQPVTETTNPATLAPFTFGLGDNQIGAELSGHSRNDYTRYSVALLSSNDGNVSLPNGHGYDTYLAFSQAFEAGTLGLQRVGTFAYIGRAPTYLTTSSFGGDGLGQKSFYRAGFYGLWYIKKLDFMTMYTHAGDNVFLGTGTPSFRALPTGARGPTWNGGMIETHYTFNPQFILINRYELIRMSRQALPVVAGVFEPGVSVPSGNFGDIDVLTFGYRYYPFVSSRTGFAFHNEYSILRQRGVSPINNLDLTRSSLFLGWDFIF